MTGSPTRMITDRVDILQKVRDFMHKYDFTGHRQQLVISLLSVCSDYFSAGEMRHCVRMGSPKAFEVDPFSHEHLPLQNQPESSVSTTPKPSLRATLSLEVDYDNISEQEIVDGLGCMIDTAMDNGLLTGSTDGEIRDWESFIKVVEIKDGVPVPKDV